MNDSNRPGTWFSDADRWFSDADRARLWLAAQLWIVSSSWTNPDTSEKKPTPSVRRPFPATGARKLKKQLGSDQSSDSEPPVSTGKQETLSFAKWVADDMDTIIRIPIYTIGWKGQKAEIWRNLNGSRKRVSIDPAFDSEHIEPPFRLGARSYVCIGKDEQSRRIFRLDDLETKQVTYIGFYPINIGMDQSKIIGFTGLDSIASWHPNGSRTVLLDGETSEILHMEGVVDVHAVFRNPKAPNERLLLLQQSWRYSSEIPKSDTQIYIWNTGASHPTRIPIPPEIPNMVLHRAKSGSLFGTEQTIPIIAFPSWNEPESSLVGMDFSGNVYTLVETGESWIYTLDWRTAHADTDTPPNAT